MTATAVSKVGKIPSLDGIRAVAVLVVFAGHAALPPLIRDTTGVTIFFFLSGFLITTLLNREHDKYGRMSIKAFYVRRAFRILPVLYTVLALIILANLAGAIGNTMSAGGAAATLLQFTNYWIIFEGREGLPVYTAMLWSLNVEEHFYLVFPFVQILLWKYLPTKRAQAVFLGAICAGFLLWRIYLEWVVDAGFDRLYLATDTRADSILYGAIMAIACNPLTGNALFGGRRPWAMFLAGIGFFGVARVIPGDAGMLSFGHTIEAAGLFLIFTAIIVAPDTAFGRFLNWRPIAYLGVLSYAFYLVHRPILIIIEQHTNLGVYPTAALGLVLSAALSHGLRHLVEKPMLSIGGTVAASIKAKGAPAEVGRDA